MRAVDQYGQVTDVPVSARRNADTARRLYRRALATPTVTPTEVVTDVAAVYPGVPRRADRVRVAPRRVRQQSD
jgi:transposase-like protein